MGVHTGIQEVMLNIGRSGCYFLSLLHIAEILSKKDIDVLNAYNLCITCGYMKRNCFILYPSRILEFFTNLKFDFKMESATYSISPNEFVIARYVRNTGKSKDEHFVVVDSNKELLFDPLEVSPTRQYGYLESLRVYRVII